MITAIEKIKHNSKKYNIQVANTNNYYANNILVHNCQILQSLLDEFKGQKFFATEKLDGSSTTMYIDEEGIFRVCGRQWQWADDDKNAMWRYAKEHNIEEKLRSLNYRAAISGEIIGDGIQSNLYKIKGHRIYFYSLFNIDTHERVGYDQFVSTIDNLQLLKCPEILTNFEMVNDIEILASMADGKSVINPQTDREGLVFRPMVNTIAPGYELPHDILSFKSISSKFLLKHDD